MFTVSSVSVKELWQCNMRAENTRSEVTGIVKSFLKVSFGTKTWGTRPPPPLHPPSYSAAYYLDFNSIEAIAIAPKIVAVAETPILDLV